MESLNLSFDPYTLRDDIKKKFGKVSRFARIAGYDQNDLHSWLKGPFTSRDEERLKEIYKKAKKLKDQQIDGIELTDEQREKLRNAITKEGKRTIKTFCEKNPDFIQSWISKVLNGDIKKITHNVKTLAKSVKVKL